MNEQTITIETISRETIGEVETKLSDARAELDAARDVYRSAQARGDADAAARAYEAISPFRVTVEKIERALRSAASANASARSAAAANLAARDEIAALGGV